MADQVQSFSVTVPAGTPIASPYVQQMPVGVWEVDQINVKVPAGCNGFVGFQIGMTGAQQIPFNAGEWGVYNDDYLEFPLTNQPNSGAWECTAYNLGNFQHILQITFLLVLVPTPSVTYTPIAALGGS